MLQEPDLISTSQTISKLAKIASVVGPLADIGGGVLGIVLGAKEFQNGTTTDKVLGFTNAASGAAIAGSGVGSLISAGMQLLSKTPPAWLTVVNPALAGAGMILGIAATIGSLIASAVEETKAAKAAVNNELDMMKKFADDGITKSDWDTKFSYARNTLMDYRVRDAPKGTNETIFAANNKEYDAYAEYFKDNKMAGYSSYLDFKKHGPDDAKHIVHAHKPPQKTGVGTTYISA